MIPISQLIQLLRIYPYEYMDDCEKFNKTEKEDFYSHLNMKDITETDYKHARSLCKDLEIKNLGEICMFKVIHYC